MQIFSVSTNTVKVPGSHITPLPGIFAQTHSLWGGLGYVPVGQVVDISEPLLIMQIDRLAQCV